MKAFPHISKIHSYGGNSVIKEEITSGGMDLRDYFAAKAMQAIVSTVPHLSMIRQDLAAIEAYQYADAMLKAREYERD